MYGLWHHLTHKCLTYNKGDATIHTCVPRGPWGEMHIQYRPNAATEPYFIDVDELKRIIDEE